MRIAPSILSADFTKLASEIERMDEAGAGQLHLDVMDGHYVPNLTFGPMVVSAVRECTSLPLDVHLMIEHADRWVEAFMDAGADMIAVHPETLYHPHLVLSSIRKRGKKWQAQVRRIGQRSASRSFSFKADAESWTREMEGRADRDVLGGDHLELEHLTVKDVLTR